MESVAQPRAVSNMGGTRPPPMSLAYPSHMLDMPVILTGFWETPQP